MSKPFIKFSWNGKWKTVSNHLNCFMNCSQAKSGHRSAGTAFSMEKPNIQLPVRFEKNDVSFGYKC